MTRKPSVCVHKARQHGSDQLLGRHSLLSSLSRKRGGVGDKVAVDDGRQLHRHFDRPVISERSQLGDR